MKYFIKLLKEANVDQLWMISLPALIITLILLPFLALAAFCVMVFTIMRKVFPSIEFLGRLLDMTLERVKSIVSFGESFSSEKDNKIWVRTMYGRKGSPKLKVKDLKSRESENLSTELKRFASVISWICSTPDLRPAYVSFFRRIERMIALNGSTWVFKYLKECMRLTVRSLAGSPESNIVGVSLDKYGLPKILPLPLREELRKYIDSTSVYGGLPVHDVNYIKPVINPNWSQKRIVSVLSILSIFRVLKTSVKPSVKTIIAPFTGTMTTFSKDLIQEGILALAQPVKIGNKWNATLKKLEPKFKPGIPFSVKIGSFIPHMSPKSGPNGSLSTWCAALDAFAFMHEPKKALVLLGWMYDQKAFGYIFWFVGLNLVFGLPYILWFHIIELLKLIRHNKYVAHYPSIYYSFPFLVIEWILGRLRVGVGMFRGERPHLYLGKLGVVYDQAGKARVVAATNWWLQSAFKGLHDSIFSNLKTLATDGTFDQQLAFRNFLSKLDRNHKMSGFDLSAATDRLPIDLQADILSALGIDGWSWKELLSFDWAVPFETVEDIGKCRYAVGQPMGAYSSWAMLALTHHIIIYVACSRAEVDYSTVNYAVLGDDVIINNDDVAIKYREIMNDLGIEISLGKSVISARFTEFAKRLQGPNDLDFSPIGAGAVLAACRSGYLFPALFRAAWHNVLLSVQDALDLADKVPSGLVARRDVKKFMSLVMWQFTIAPSLPPSVSPSQFSACAVEWVSSLPEVPNQLVEHIFDSIGIINMRAHRAAVRDAYLPLANTLIGLFTLTVSTSPVLRVLETLSNLFNPGFWLYVDSALSFSERSWKDIESFYSNMPKGVEAGYMETLEKLKYTVHHHPSSAVAEIPLSKKEAQLQATFVENIKRDIWNRYEISERHVLHRNFYELQLHYGRSDWPDIFREDKPLFNRGTFGSKA